MASPECRMINASIVCHAIKTGQLDPNDPNLKSVGILRYIGPDCRIEYGGKAESDAWTTLWRAIDGLHLKEIFEAHSASGRYCSCIC